jgi:hypothetical protein
MWIRWIRIRNTGLQHTVSDRLFLLSPRFGRCRRRVTRRPTPPWPANRSLTAFRPATSSSRSSRLSTNPSSMPPLLLHPRSSCSTTARVLPALWRRRAVELTATRNDRSVADLRIRSKAHPHHVIIAARGWEERKGAAPPLRHQWRIPGKEIKVMFIGFPI